MNSPLATPLFMKRSAAAALNAFITLRSMSHRRHKEGTVVIYCEATEYVLKTYDTDEEIAETDADIIRFTQPSNMWPTEYAEALWSMVLQCN